MKIERQMILRTLDKTNNNKTRAAELLKDNHRPPIDGCITKLTQLI